MDQFLCQCVQRILYLQFHNVAKYALTISALQWSSPTSLLSWSNYQASVCFAAVNLNNFHSCLSLSVCISLFLSFSVMTDIWKSLSYVFKVPYWHCLHFLEGDLFDIEFEFDIIIIMFTVSCVNGVMLHVCTEWDWPVSRSPPLGRLWPRCCPVCPPLEVRKDLMCVRKLMISQLSLPHDIKVKVN